MHMTDAPVTTTGQLLVAQVRGRPDGVAYARKRLGIWEERSWAQLGDEVAEGVAVLRQAAIGRGDRVLLMGDVRPELVTVLLAAQLIGAECVLCYPTVSSADLAGLVETAVPDLVVGEVEEDTELAAKSGSTASRSIVVSGSPVGGADHLTWAEALASAREGGPIDLEALASQVKSDDLAFLVPTAGTSGPPHLVPVTHHNLLSAWNGVWEIAPEITATDRVLVDSPLAHPAGQATALVLPLLFGCRTFYVDDVAEYSPAVREVQPTVSVSTARRWVRTASRLEAALASSTRVKRALFRFGLRLESGPLRWLGSRLSSRAIFEQLGYARLRVAVVGWSALPERAAAFWSSMGLELTEVYGLAETAGVAARINPVDRTMTPLGDSALHVRETGEICVSGSAVAVAVDIAGGVDDGDGGRWCATGDMARVADGGDLRFIGRLTGALADSTTTVQEMEWLLMDSPFILEVVVVDNGSDGLRAHVGLDTDVTAEWAHRHGIRFTTHDELVTHEAVHEILTREVADRIGEASGLPEIRHLVLLDKPLGHEEMTPTREVRDEFRAQLAKNAVTA